MVSVAARLFDVCILQTVAMDVIRISAHLSTREKTSQGFQDFGRVTDRSEIDAVPMRAHANGVHDASKRRIEIFPVMSSCDLRTTILIVCQDETRLAEDENSDAVFQGDWITLSVVLQSLVKGTKTVVCEEDRSPRS